MESKITYRVKIDDEDIPIPGRAIVTFEIDRCAIEFSLRDDEVRVRSAGGNLIIEPVAGNGANLSVVWR